MYMAVVFFEVRDETFLNFRKSENNSGPTNDAV
jgi:hypothetical protein